MNKKDKDLIFLLDQIEQNFGKNIFTRVDYWQTSDAIGLQKDNKLIYLSTLGAPKYECFYECEELLDDEDLPYKSMGYGNVTYDEVFAKISEFFAINRKTLKH